MKFDYSCILILYVLSYLHQSACQIVDYSAQIFENITTGYKKEFLPISENSTSLDVDLQTYLIAFNNVEQSQEILRITSLVEMHWRDSRLSWDSSVYGNTTWLTLTSNDIWLPYISLLNSVDTLKPIGFAEDSKSYISIFHTGDAYWRSGTVFETRCAMDISKFPFDEQTCKFIIGVWAGNATNIKTIPVTNTSDLTYFTRGSDWNITQHTQYSEELNGSNNFVLELSIKRQSSYITAVVILPSMFISLINPFMFLLPVESGERMSFGITMLLSYIIFLSIAVSSIPASSAPVLSLVLLSMMEFSTFSIFFSVLSVFCFFLEDNSEGFLFRCLAFYFQTRRRYNTEGQPIPRITGKDISKKIDSLSFKVFFFTNIALIVVYVIAMWSL